MGLSLETKTLGGGDAAFEWLLHSSGSSLAGGLRVSLGGGGDTPLGLSADGVRIFAGGGYHHELRSLAGSNRIVELADAAGRVFPATLIRLTADATNDQTSDSEVAGFSFTPEVSSLYEFEGVLLFTSAATTTGAQFKLLGPAEVSLVAWQALLVISSGFAAAYGVQANGWGVEFAATSAPAAATVFAVPVRGVFRTTATTPSSTVRLSINSEVGGSEIALKADSWILFRKVA